MLYNEKFNMKTLFFVIVFVFIEVLILIKIGSFTGLVISVSLIFVSAFIGYTLIRKLSIKTLFRNPKNINNQEMSINGMAKAISYIFSGILLILPGYITDILGLLIIIPIIQKLAWSYLLHKLYIKFNRPPVGGDNFNNLEETTIEGEFINIDDEDKI